MASGQKLGQRPSTYTIRTVSQETGQTEKTGFPLVRWPAFVPQEAQRQDGGTSRYHADPWGGCGTASMEESMMYLEESMMYPGSM